MQTEDKNQNPPQTADAPKGELMKCPKCGGDSFLIGKTAVSENVRCWRVPDRWGAGIRVEGVNPSGYDDLHMMCLECQATFEDNDILKMWNVGGWWD